MEDECPIHDPFDDFFDMSDDSGTNSNALGNMTTGSSDLLDDDWSSWDNLDSIVPSSSKQSSQQPNKTTSQPLKLSHSTTGTTTVNKITPNTSNNNLLEDDFFAK
ncbi:hypothetical protein FDP41_008279 [Naegleria fowleri]|uniref:Uncharacterized protein n=1 Tax=Naegleria fowleri TaxID=5763 RepID=A0A6A5BIM8_NAEFO|nr:uncharacterized protein FDP41_008279 [Naegleria fowleri]KAF0973575.1 hypothetical protein FDP41_008279 [Naegleria fowleri]CAG4709209.1 unnamed protein product [Naegleria fowleri]